MDFRLDYDPESYEMWAAQIERIAEKAIAARKIARSMKRLAKLDEWTDTQRARWDVHARELRNAMEDI